MKRYVGLNKPWCRIPFSWGPALGFLGFSIWTLNNDTVLWQLWEDASREEFKE